MKKILSIFGIALMAIPFAGITYSSITISKNSNTENQDWIPPVQDSNFIESPTTTIFVENEQFFENSGGYGGAMKYSTPSFQTTIQLDKCVVQYPSYSCDPAGFAPKTYNLEIKVSDSYSYYMYDTNSWKDFDIDSGFAIGFALSDGDDTNNDNYYWNQDYGNSIALSMYVGEDEVLPEDYNYLQSPEKFTTLGNTYSNPIKSQNVDLLLNIPVSYFDPNDSHILVVDYKVNGTWQQVTFNINEFLRVESTEAILKNFDDKSDSYTTYWLENAENNTSSLVETQTSNGSNTYAYKLENEIYTNGSIYGVYGDNSFSKGAFEFQFKYDLESYEYSREATNEYYSGGQSSLVLSTYKADIYYSNFLVESEPGYGKFVYEGTIGYYDDYDNFVPITATIYSPDAADISGIKKTTINANDYYQFDFSMVFSNPNATTSLLMKQNNLETSYGSIENSESFIIWDVTNSSPSTYKGTVSTTTAITILVFSIAIISVSAVLYITNRRIKRKDREITSLTSDRSNIVQNDRSTRREKNTNDNMEVI